MRFKLFVFGIAVVLIGIFLLLYLPSLSFPYEFDDFSNVIQNRSIRYLTHPRIFIESEYSRNRPLTSLSFAFSYAFSGLSLSALRAPSFLIHALNALFVGLFFFRFFRGYQRAALGALLAGGIFLLHPLAVDSVVYLSGRASLLVLFFLLCALWCYGRPRPGVFSWFFFMVSALCAFLTKESALALLPLLLLYHLCLGKRWRELLPYCLPLVVGGLVAAIMKWNYLEGASRGFFQIGGEVDILSIRDYWPIAVAQWPGILRLFFRPDLQAIDHQIFVPSSWQDPQAIGGILIWATTPFLVFGLCRWRAPIFFCMLWLFASLSITNSVFPILDPFAERHFYLALPALAWVISFLFLRLLERAPVASWVMPFLLLGTVSYAATAPRIEQWRTSESIWMDAYRKYPNKLRVVFNTWSVLFSQVGGDLRALTVLLDYLEGVKPGKLTYEEQSLVVKMAATTLQGRIAKDGGSVWKRGREILGGRHDFWSEVILLRAAIGKSADPQWLTNWAEAAERFEGARLGSRAKSREPNFTVNTFMLLRAQYFASIGNRKTAIKQFEEVFRQFPGRYFPYWTVREELGDLYLLEGNEEDAIRQYEQATYQYLSFKRFPASLYKKLLDIFKRRKEINRASDAIGQLVRVQSDNKEVRQLYAEILRARADKNALRQTKEAEFYSEHAISPLDLREAVAP